MHINDGWSEYKSDCDAENDCLIGRIETIEQGIGQIRSCVLFARRATVRIRSSPPTAIRSPKAISGTNVRNTSIRCLASGVRNRLTTITKEIIH